MVGQPIDILDRPQVELPRRLSAASPAERYLAMRARKLTLTHQQAMDEFARTVGQVYRTVDELMTAYFGRFKKQRDEQLKAYDAQVQKIRDDRRIDVLRQEQAIQQLRIPLMPAWGEDSERGFLYTYGNPRENVIEWNSQLNLLGQEQVMILREGRQGAWVRTQWEMMIPKLLERPELDGSVAACKFIDVGMVVAATDRADARFTRSQFAPAVDPDINPALYEAMQKAAQAVCPHCFEVFPRGFKSHELACARRHEVESIFANDPIDGDAEGLVE